MNGRVRHGGHPMFAEHADRIEAAVGPGELPIMTRGAMREQWPTSFVAYNTEPMHARTPPPLYATMLERAEKVYDYSEPNVRAYPRSEFRPLALGQVMAPTPPATCDVDVLFYGLMTPRRQALVEATGATVVDRVFGAERERWIRRSRVVLCVNAYDNVNNNALRAFIALESGARLLVERTSEEWYNEACSKHAVVASYEDLAPTCHRMVDEYRGAA